MTVKDLGNHGIDLATAMENCADDEEIYTEVLQTFLEEGREKVRLFKELIEQKDYERYGIEGHGLKNAAITIGAVKLSNLGKSAEFACKEGNYAAIDGAHDLLICEYERVLDLISQIS